MAGEQTLGTCLRGWLERQQTQLQPGTWDSYRGMVRRYVLLHVLTAVLTIP